MNNFFVMLVRIQDWLDRVKEVIPLAQDSAFKRDYCILSDGAHEMWHIFPQMSPFSYAPLGNGLTFLRSVDISNRQTQTSGTRTDASGNHRIRT